MSHENSHPASASGRCRGPQGPGEQAAAAPGEGAPAGERFGAMEAQERLRRWAEKIGQLISESDWLTLKLISAATAEHEVRYRASDHRAVKRTWPGTSGFVPAQRSGQWVPRAATPQEYLLRQRLQNDLFDDDIRLEGVMANVGPSSWQDEICWTRPWWHQLARLGTGRRCGRPSALRFEFKFWFFRSCTGNRPSRRSAPWCGRLRRRAALTTLRA
jgi:hypothetical protein